MAKAANLFQRGDIWYFRKKLPGQKRRVTVSTGCKDLNQAKRRKTELEKEVNDDAFGWKKKTIAPTVVDYLQDCVKLYGPAHQGRAFMQAIGLATEFWQAPHVPALPARLDGVLPQHCTMLVNFLTAHGYAKSTVRNRTGYLKALWNHAMRAELVTKNPWTGLTIPKGKPRQRVLKEGSEQPRVLAALKPTWRRAAEFDLLTGLRHDELIHLTDEDIDFTQRTVRVANGKGGKQRYVPLSPEAANIAREQIAARDNGTMGVRLVWRTRRAITEHRIWPFARGTFLNVMRDAAVEAGAPHITVHDLRRSFGTRCAMSGVPMKRLQEWMGHSNITTTATFYVVTDTKNDIELMAGLRASVNVPARRDDGTEVTKVVTFAKAE